MQNQTMWRGKNIHSDRDAQMKTEQEKSKAQYATALYQKPSGQIGNSV